jgi:hypothetical protein
MRVAAAGRRRFRGYASRRGSSTLSGRIATKLVHESRRNEGEPAITATLPHRRRSTRIARPLLAAAMLLATVPLAGAGAGDVTGDDLRACGTPGQVQLRDDTWARIRSPRYAANEGERKVTAFAVPEALRAWVYVTNGSVVQLSTSAGCTWDHVYPAPGQTDAVPAPRARVVTQLLAPSARGLWVTSYDDAGGVAHPHVARTADATPAPGNKTVAPFESLDTGLPAVGRPVRLAVSPANSDRAYLILDTAPDATTGSTAPRRRLYRSAVDPSMTELKLPDTTWNELALPAAVAAPAGVAVSPVDSGNVWVWAGSTYAFTTDGGDHWQAAPAGGEVTTVDVDASGRAAVFTGAGEGGTMTFVDGSGRVEGSRATPVTPALAAHAVRYDAFAVAGPGGTFGYDVNHKRWVAIHPRGVAPFERIAFGAKRNGRILIGQSGGDLYRFDLYAHDAFLKPPKVVEGPPIEVNERTGLTRPVLRLARREVTVAPGEQVPVPVDFGVPPSPVPLDVFFLMDTTNSMGEAIAGLRNGVKQIAANLKRRTHGSACFGVGDVKDEALATTDGTQLAPYRLVQPITCDLGRLQTAVDQLKEGGGNIDQNEAQTIALTQAVTGKGQVEPPAVLSGQDAGFTAPTRVIVLLTDAGFMQGTSGGYTFPTIDDTVKTLNAYHDVKVVGIVVHDNNNFQRAYGDVTQVVRGTSTFAPEFGADCDSDGVIDVEPGQPLVCETDNSAPAIEPAIVALLLGVKDPGTIASRIADPHHLVARVDGATSRVVDLKRENHLAYTLRLTCAAAQDGQDLPLRLVQAVRDEDVLAGEVLVRCRSRAKVVPPPPRRPRAPEVPEPPPAPLRPLVLPVFLPELNPVPPNPPNNLNPNAGLSQEEQKQFQLATVSQGAAENEEQQEDVELAMTGLTLGSAAVMSAAAAWAMRRRRTQVAPAYSRIS